MTLLAAVFLVSCMIFFLSFGIVAAEERFVVTRPLHYGMSGSDVASLQKFLKDLGYFTYPAITDYFGSYTRKAVTDFQKANKIDPIGLVGPVTRAKLSELSLSLSQGNSSAGVPAPRDSASGSLAAPRRGAPVSLGAGTLALYSGSPSGTLAFGTTDATLYVSTSDTAACRYSSDPGISYGSMTPFATTGQVHHFSPIAGLSGGGNYSYYVKCQNIADGATSADYLISFSIAPDRGAPSVVLSSPSNNGTVSGISGALSAQASDSGGIAGVRFILDDGVPIGSEDISSPYSVVWDSTAVTDGFHTISAVARDTSGNYATSSSVTVTVDNTAPLISSVASTTDSSSATVTWITNEPSNSRIVYGPTSSYGLASTSAGMVMSHSVSITGLSANTAYRFAVVSTDVWGNTATSSEEVLLTESYIALLQSDQNLLALWRMNESSGASLVDSKNGYNAGISGGVTLGSASSYVSSDSSTAATFNGTSGYASVGDISALDFSRTSPFMISAIIKPTTSANTNYWIYTKAKDSSPNNGLEFGVRKSSQINGNPTGLFVQFGASDPSQIIRLISDQNLINGQSYLVGLTYDGSGTAAGMHMYIDGNTVTSYDDSGAKSQTIDAGQTTTASGYPAQLGKWGSVNQYFNGDIKDLALFNSAKSSDWMRALAVAARSSNANVSVNPSTIYTPYSSSRPQIIVDQDIDSDIDDVVDLVTLLNLEHRGEINLVGGIVSSSNTKAAPAWLAIANYYGRSSIPVGVNTSAAGSNTSTYDSTLASTYGVSGKTDASNFPVATSTQRQILAAAADHSIDYLTTGALSSVRDLLQTGPDQYSSLSGADLVAQKVHSLWIAAGRWPSGPAVSDFGVYAGTITASDYVLNHWPASVPIMLDSISDGDSVSTGQNVMVAMNSANPARAAWLAYFGNSNTTNKRPAWSQIAILPLVRGLGTYMTIGGGNGKASIDGSTGNTSWTQTVNSNQSYLAKVMSNAGLVSAINALILDPSAW